MERVFEEITIFVQGVLFVLRYSDDPLRDAYQTMMHNLIGITYVFEDYQYKKIFEETAEECNVKLTAWNYDRYLKAYIVTVLEGKDWKLFDRLIKEKFEYTIQKGKCINSQMVFIK